MYGKLFNRLKKGCQSVKKSARSIGTSSKSNSPEVENSNELVEQEHSENEENFAKNFHTFGLDLLDTDTSDEDFKNQEKVKPSISLETTASSFDCEHSTSSSSASDIDQFWIGFINSHAYKNWLKVGLALRLVCTFLTPLLEEIVQQLHSSLICKHGYGKLTQQHIESYKQNTSETQLLRGWMKDVLKLHRHPPAPAEVFRISDVTKWPTSDGPWEIARVYMSKGYRTGGEGGDVSHFDVSALLNFMYRCRIFDKYVHDFTTVKRVLQVRNATMHNPSLTVDDNDMNENFQTVLDLFEDQYLSQHLEKHFTADEVHKSLNKIKLSSFDLITSAQHSLEILKDDVFQPTNLGNHPSAKTLGLLRDVLSKILSLPQVHASVDLKKIQTKITEMETKVEKEYEEADKKIKKISAHVEHMNKKLDHLRYFMAKSKANEDEVVEDSSPVVRKRKRKRNSSRDSFSDNQTKKPYPTGILLQNNTMQGNYADYWNKEKHVRFDQSSTPCSSSDGTSPSVSSVNSFPGSSTDSDNIHLYSQFTSPDMQTTLSKKTFPHRKRNIVDSPEEDSFFNSNTPPPKRRRISDSKKDFSPPQKKASNTNLIIIPNAKNNSAANRSAVYEGQGGDTYLVRRLQEFLRKQPDNDGAVFTIRVDADNKFFCSVSFQSLYAVSSPNLSYSIDEAKYQAADEARKRIPKSPKDAEVEDSKNWFDNYAKKKTGKLPKYTCFQTRADLYYTHIHMINKNLLRTGAAESHQIFLEASCSTKNPTVDIKNSAIQSALEGTPLPLSSYKKDDYLKILNEFCLANDATLPMFQCNSSRCSKNSRVVYTCSFKSFIKKHLSQKLRSKDDHLGNRASSSSIYNFSPMIEDFAEAQSSVAHRSQILAEESAAENLLSKLGLSETRLNETKGSHKIELKNFIKELDLSTAYHTMKVQSKEEPDEALYNCVVTSPCLKTAQCNFTATSDNMGSKTQDEACESAARNSLILLGMEIVFGLK